MNVESILDTGSTGAIRIRLDRLTLVNNTLTGIQPFIKFDSFIYTNLTAKMSKCVIT